MEEDIKKEMEMEKTKGTNEIEEILELARDVKLSEEELIKEAIQEKIKQIAELQEKNKELNKQILYLKAEFDNYRKRVEKEKQQKFLLGKISVFEKIIYLYEMFKIAIESLQKINLEKTNEFIQVFNGLNLLYKEFENFLAKEGVSKIDCINKKVDPKYHEVVEYVENDTKDEDTIIEIISDGYILINNNEEFVLRPAKVKVVKKGNKENLEDENMNIEKNEN
jgi:molecular chaperone GrpE